MVQSGMMQQALKGLLDPESRFKADEKTGRKILVTAWVVEILAASIGLFIAWTNGFRALYNVPNPNINDYISAILGALPFVIIAVIEPMKIPLAAGFYRVKQIGWKVLILAGLLGLTTVTFETMFNGLEQQNYNVTRVIKEASEQIQGLESEIKNAKKNLFNIQSNTKENVIANSEKNISVLRNSSRQKLDLINKEIEALTVDRKSERLEKQKEINRLTALNTATSPSAEEKAIKETLIFLESARNKEIERKEEEINAYKNFVKNKNNNEKLRKDEFYKKNEEKIIQIQAEIKEIGEYREKLNSQLELSKNNINKNLQIILSNINDTYAAQLESCNFSCATISGKKQKERDAAQLKATDELKAREEDFAKNREKVNENIEEKRKIIAAIKSETYQEKPAEELDDRKIAQIEKNYASKIKSFDDQISAENAKLIDRAKTRSGETKTRIAEIQKDIQLIDQAIAEIQNQYDPRIAALNNQTDLDISKIQTAREEELEKITERRKEIGAIELLIKEKDEEISKLRSVKRSASRESNLYRLAQLIYGVDDIDNVTLDQIKWVSLIWFGSIAFIAATVGTILALISFILRDPKAFEERERWYRARTLMKYVRLGSMRVFILARALAVLLAAISNLLFSIPASLRGFFGRRLQRSVRGLSASIRKRVSQPKVKIEQVEKEVIVVKEVIKEVPVEKVVIKEVVKEIIKEVPVDRIVIQEVPVEVVKETVVHVPIASDDLSVLNIQGRDKDGR